MCNFKWTLSIKLWSFLVVATVVLLATGASQFASTRAHLFELRKQEAESALRAVLTVVEAYEEDVRGGRRTRAHAQAAVRRMLLAYRFAQGEGYVGVLDDGHRVLIQPAHPETEGDDETDRQSHDGRFIAREAVAIGRDHGFGFNTYPYVNPDSGAPDVKTSAIARFEPWGWTLVAGVFQRQFDDAMQALAYRAIVEAGVALLVLILSAAIVIRRLVRPLAELSVAAERVASGDRGVRIGYQTRTDEIGRLARALRRVCRPEP